MHLGARTDFEGKTGELYACIGYCSNQAGQDAAATLYYEQAVKALSQADPAWLSGLVNRRVPLSMWQEVLTMQPGDVKVVVDLTR